jgi:hypothetical protein
VKAVSVLLMAGVGSLLISVLPATAAPKPQVITFVSVQATAHETKISATSTRVLLTDNDYAGKQKIGHDTVNCLLARGVLHCSIAFSLGKGTILARATVKDDAATTKGVISGGTGAYAGATGVLSTRNLNKAGTRTQITLAVR